ncbi:MAG: hypothetical protein QW097_00365 [archaeon]
MVEFGLEEYFMLPKQTPKSDPCWFGFILTIKYKYMDLIRRNELQQYLYNNKMDSRVLFTRNITKQPVSIENEINLQSDWEFIEHGENNEKFLMGWNPPRS